MDRLLDGIAQGTIDLGEIAMDERVGLEPVIREAVDLSLANLRRFGLIGTM